MSKVLSIEIGPSITTVCEMDMKVKRPKIHNTMMLSTPRGVLDDLALSNFDSFAKALSKKLREKNFTAKKAIFSVNTTITKNKLISKYTEFAQKVGLEACAIDFGVNEIYTALKSECPSACAIVRCEEDATSIIKVKNDKIYYSTAVAAGLSSMFDILIDDESIKEVNSRLDAISYMRAYDCINSRSDIKQKTVDYVDEIKNVLKDEKNIVVTGIAASTKGFADILEKKTKAKVIVIDKISAIKTDKKLNGGCINDYIGCISAALWPENFLYDINENKIVNTPKKSDFRLLFALVAAIMTVFALSFMFLYADAHTLNRKLSNELINKETMIEELQNENNLMNEEIEEKKSYIDEKDEYIKELEDKIKENEEKIKELEEENKKLEEENTIPMQKDVEKNGYGAYGAELG